MKNYVAGVFATIVWEEMYNEEVVYISFSPDPMQGHDIYGVEDTQIFYYAERREFAELFEPYNGNGWRVISVESTNIIKHQTQQ